MVLPPLTPARTAGMARPDVRSKPRLSFGRVVQGRGGSGATRSRDQRNADTLASSRIRQCRLVRGFLLTRAEIAPHQAARTVSMNLPTSILSRLLSLDSD